jgi:hypothetical protein
MCRQFFNPIFHYEYDVLAHEFCIGAPTLIFDQACVCNIYGGCLLSDKFNNALVVDENTVQCLTHLHGNLSWMSFKHSLKNVKMKLLMQL